MDRHRYPSLGRLLLAAFGAAVLFNLVFLMLLAAMPENPGLIADRVKRAFETGDLGTLDYLPRDSRRGWHQYNDCVVLQMLSNGDSSRINRAIAPIVYLKNEDWSEQCITLHLLVTEKTDRDHLLVARYGRYWHGYLLPTALALQVMELKDFRRLLAGAVWLALVILFTVAFKSGSYTKLAGMSIALVAMTLWAVPYFGPSLTHGPGDALLLLALAGIIILSYRFNGHKALVLYSSVFGATVIFFEMTTGQVPVAAAWLTVLMLALGRDKMGSESRDVIFLVLMVVVAFGIGLIVTVTAKQILASLLLDASANDQFFSHLRYYMDIPASEEGWPGLLVPFGRLIRKSYILTFYNEPASYGLILITAIIWVSAVLRGWSQWAVEQSRVDLLILIGAALIPVIWVFLLPRHTYNHAAFMVRMLVVPISLAPVTLFWSQSTTKRVPLIPDGKLQS